jgi:hypothetical protein
MPSPWRGPTKPPHRVLLNARVGMRRQHHDGQLGPVLMDPCSSGGQAVWRD